MKNLYNTILRVGALLAMLVGVLVATPTSAAPVKQGEEIWLAATLPASTCTLVAPATRTCQLWAKPGTTTLPDGLTVPIWGYTAHPAGTPTISGPSLIVNQGDTVNVVLNNTLTVPTALVFPGIEIVPDMTPVASGGAKTYSFTASLPGTYLYEAGMLPDSAIQVAMGLYGALIVRPAGAPDQAYVSVDTRFVHEAALVFGELDPRLNLSADPSSFDITTYNPTYRLINGQPYPGTSPIRTSPGSKLLLRVINAGFTQSTFGLLGLRQEVLAVDANPYPHSFSVVAESIASGETMDILVDIAADAAPRTMYAVYETGGHTHNAGKISQTNSPITLGGAMTFITIPSAPLGPDVLGPLVSSLSVAPSPTDGALGVTLAGTVSDFATGGLPVTTAEYFIGFVGAPGTGTTLTGVYSTTTVAVSAALSPATLSTLGTGEHMFYVRGRDAAGNWGPFSSAALQLVQSGPVISGLELRTTPTNGTKIVKLQATGDGRPSGNVNVVAAEYFIGAAGADGTGSSMSLNAVMPVASLTADIPAAGIATLGEGQHTVYVHAQDNLGHWGGFGQIVLDVDVTGPIVNSVTVTPTPNNGWQGIQVDQQYVRLEAALTDVASNGVSSHLIAAEYFLHTPGADGTGTDIIAVDGIYNQKTETVYLHIPLVNIRNLPAGEHVFFVDGQDAAGNWGPMASASLIVDKTAPVVSGLGLSPNPAVRVGSVLLTGVAADALNAGAAASPIVAAEWFIGVDPGKGMGNAINATDGAFDSTSEALSSSIAIAGWRRGTYVISVRAKDAAGNWGATVNVTLVIERSAPVTMQSDTFELGIASWGATGSVSASAAASLEAGGALGMAVNIVSAQPAYVIDLSPSNDILYSARFLFDPNGVALADSYHDIFVGLDAAGNPIFGLHLEESAAGAYEVRAWARYANGLAYTDWYDIQNGVNQLEIRWKAGYDGQLALNIAGVNVAELVNVDTSAYLLDEVRLGAPDGLQPGMVGVEFFDAFISSRAAGIVVINSFLPFISH